MVGENASKIRYMKPVAMRLDEDENGMGVCNATGSGNAASCIQGLVATYCSYGADHSA